MQKQLSVKKFFSKLSVTTLCLLLASTNLVHAQTSAKSKSVKAKKAASQVVAGKKKKATGKATGVKASKSAAQSKVVKSVAKPKMVTIDTQPTLKQINTAGGRNQNQAVYQRSVSPVRLPEVSNPKLVTTSSSKFSQTQSLAFIAKDEDKSSFSGSVGLSYSESLVDHQDGSKQASQSFNARLGYAITENFSSSLGFAVQQDLRDKESKANGLSDISVSLSRKPWSLADWVKGTLSVSTLISASEQTTKVIGLQSAVGTSFTFSLTEEVLAKGFSTSLTLGANRNFHKYETSVDGRVLNPYSVKEVLSVGYSFPKYISLSAELMHRHAWSYNGNVSQSFEHSEEIGYSVTPQWGVALGHTNSGSWLKPNGQDSNLKVINEDDSIVYVSTSLSF